MKNYFFLLLMAFLLLPSISRSQNFIITAPVMEFDGTVLQISYDIISKNKSDQFIIWVEITDKNGGRIKAASLSGDVGDNVKSGKGKKIWWYPEKDSVIINEEVSVELKGQMYEKSFNKGTAVLLSALLPGLGQTKISGGKPYWITGIAAYGALAGGFVMNSKAQGNYDSYKSSEDITEREDLFDTAQKQKGLAQGLLISGAAIWAANMVWVAIMPVAQKPVQHISLTLDPYYSPVIGTTLLTFRLNF